MNKTILCLSIYINYSINNSIAFLQIHKFYVVYLCGVCNAKILTTRY